MCKSRSQVRIMPGTSGRPPAITTDTASDLAKAAAAEGIEPLVAIIDRLRDRLRPSLWTYMRTRPTCAAGGPCGTSVAMCSAAPCTACRKPSAAAWPKSASAPATSPACREVFAPKSSQLLRPGDVLVVRKEFAATNYFLPGHWPHAALFLGTAGDFASGAIADHPHVRPRLPQLVAATHTTAVLVPDLENAWMDGAADGASTPAFWRR